MVFQPARDIDDRHCYRPGPPDDREVVRRLIPFIFLCYVIAYIDRVNIGFAATELQRDLGLSDAAYGLGGGLFFLGYCLFEIPSNLIMDRVARASGSRGS